MSLFVRVVTHYSSNEANDSLGVFSDNVYMRVRACQRASVTLMYAAN